MIIIMPMPDAWLLRLADLNLWLLAWVSRLLSLHSSSLNHFTCNRWRGNQRIRIPTPGIPVGHGVPSPETLHQTVRGQRRGTARLLSPNRKQGRPEKVSHPIRHVRQSKHGSMSSLKEKSGPCFLLLFSFKEQTFSDRRVKMWCKSDTK